MMLRTHFVLCMVFCFCVTTCRNANADTPIGVARDGALEVAFSSPFSTVPPLGMWPLDVSVENRSPRERSVAIVVRISRSGYPTAETIVRRTVTAAPSATAKYQLVVPIPIVSLDRRGEHSGDLWFSIDEIPHATIEIENFAGDTRLVTDNAYGYSSSGSEQIYAYFIISRGWATGQGALNDLFKEKHLGDFYGTFLEVPASLPRDWRALSGVHSMFLTADDWVELDQAQRSSIRTWIASGGTLVFDSRGGSYPDELPVDKSDTATRLGFGSIVPKAGSLAGIIKSLGTAPTRLDFSHSALGIGAIDLTTAVKQPSEESLGTVLFIVAAYSLMVGPFSLFVLKRRKKLLLLYVTTPALALGASLLIGALILAREGIGGRGERTTLVYLSSATRQTLALQDQRSVTGLLLGKEFTLPEQTIMAAKTHDVVTYSTPALNMFVRDNRYWGQVFRDRSVQSQTLLSVEPSRAAIKVESGQDGPSSVVSSLAAPLAQIVILDGTSRAWTANKVATGVPTRLELISTAPAEFLRQLGVPADLASYTKTNALTFVAVSDISPEFVKETLSSIRWNNRSTVIFGEVVQ